MQPTVSGSSHPSDTASASVFFKQMLKGDALNKMALGGEHGATAEEASPPCHFISHQSISMGAH